VVATHELDSFVGKQFRGNRRMSWTHALDKIREPN